VEVAALCVCDFADGDYDDLCDCRRNVQCGDYGFDSICPLDGVGGVCCLGCDVADDGGADCGIGAGGLGGFAIRLETESGLDRTAGGGQCQDCRRRVGIVYGLYAAGAFQGDCGQYGGASTEL